MICPSIRSSWRCGVESSSALWSAVRWGGLAAIVVSSATLVLSHTASGSEPSHKSCTALKVALEDLTTTQAQKTAEQLEIALMQMGMTEDGRSQVVVQALSPAVLRKIRAKYDPRLRGQVQAILMLAGCK